MNTDNGTRETPRRYCEWVDDCRVSETRSSLNTPIANRRGVIVSVTKKYRR